MPGRFNIDKPNPFYKHKPRFNGYGSKESEKIILNLHQIEKQIRKEILDTQIFRWTPAMILERWPDGRA